MCYVYYLLFPLNFFKFFATLMWLVRNILAHLPFSCGRNLNREIKLVSFSCSTSTSLPSTLFGFFLPITSLLQRKTTGGYILLLIFLCHVIRGWVEAGQRRTKKILYQQESLIQIPKGTERIWPRLC